MIRMDLATERLVARRFFYGWIIVFINFVAAMITSGVGNWGLSFFVAPMSQELGVSRGAFSAITLFRLAPLPFLPLLGLLADKKHGPRVILVVGGLIGGLSLVLISEVISRLVGGLPSNEVPDGQEP